MKKLICMAVAVLLCLTLVACTGIETTKSLTFHVATGDKVCVSLKTGDGYKLHMGGDEFNGEFNVSKDDDTVLFGTFIYAEACPAYVEDIYQSAIRYEEIENGLFYQYPGDDGVQNDFIIMIPGSNTAVVLGSLADEAAAKAAFERLTIKLAD